MKKRGHTGFFLIVILCLLGAGCGGGSSQSGNTSGSQMGITVSAQPSATIDVGQSVMLIASLGSNVSGSGVTWSLQTANGSPAPGALSNQTGTTATYTAPTTVNAKTQVTVVATSASDGSVSGSMGIIINPLPTIPNPNLLSGNVGTTYSQVINASGGVPPYIWTVSSGSLPAGLALSPGTSSTSVYLSGQPSQAAISSFTLQLTDATGVVASDALSVTIYPKMLKITIPNLPVGAVGVPYLPSQLVASGGVPPYTFTLIQSGTLFPPGLTFGTDGLVSGIPTSPSTFYNLNVLVTDSRTFLPATGMAMNIPIQVFAATLGCSSGAESMLSSQAPYAFLIRGFDANGPVVLAGNFTADGLGNVTGGAEDVNRSTGVQTNLNIVSSGSSYTLGPDNRGCLTLSNSAGATNTYRFSMGSPSNGTLTRGRVIEFDDNTGTGTRASGIVRLQDSSSFSTGLNGVYAFGLSGWNASGGRYAMAGSANAGAGSLTAVAADVDDAGTLQSSLTGGSGTYTSAASGRGTSAFTVGTAALNFVMYVVDSEEAILMTTDPIDVTHPLVSGEALGTSSAFGLASLQDNYLVETNGLAQNGPDASVGVLSFNGTGTTTGTVFEDAAGNSSTNPISAFYAVDSNTGRVRFTAQNVGQSLGNHPLIGYIVSSASATSAFLVGTDASAQAGILELQGPLNTPYLLTSLSGNYVVGSDENQDATTVNLSGAVTIPPDQIIEDASLPGNAGLIPNISVFGSYSVNLDGTGAFGGNTVSVTNGKVLFYIDEAPFNTHPVVNVMEQ